MNPQQLKTRLARAFPDRRWLIDPRTQAVSTQQDSKTVTVAAVAEGFSIEMMHGDTRSAQTGQRQWAGWKDSRGLDEVLGTLRQHLGWFEQVKG